MEVRGPNAISENITSVFYVLLPLSICSTDSHGICFIMKEKEGVFAGVKVLRDLGRSRGWYGLKMGWRQKLREKLKFKRKCQNLRHKQNFLAQVTLCDVALGKRPLISSLWEKQHCSDTQGTAGMGSDKLLYQGHVWFSW